MSRTASRMEQLFHLSAALTGAVSLTDVATILTAQGAPIVGATNSAVAVPTGDENMVRVYQGPTATLGTAAIRLMDLSEPTPLTDAIRENRTVAVTTSEQFAQLYPRIAGRIEPGEVTAMITYPLVSGDEVLGSCFFRFANDAPVNAEHYEDMELIVPVLVRAVSRIRAGDELASYAKRLEQSNRDLDNFAAVAAHDLTAPVRRIGSFMQLLERELGSMPPKATKYAATINAQIMHLSALLRDTLAYAQVVAPVDTRQPTQLSELVNEVIATVDETDRPEFRVGDLPIVHVEASLLRQVLQNVVDNSIKYRRAATPLQIHISAEFLEYAVADHRAWWRIAIDDNGIGIDPDRHDEVFAMFSRLEVSDDRPGTGVGLAFVKRVVERHGGKIGIDVGIDGGTSVWFTLPGIRSADTL